MAELKNIEFERTIEYYQTRLEHVLYLWKQGEMQILSRNIDKAKELVEGYKEFKDNSAYNPALVGAIKTFILNN